MTLKRRPIPEDVREWANNVIKEFNESVIRDPHRYFLPRYRGSYLYLDRAGTFGRPGPICRLTYTGDRNNWEFAIFKYSDEVYDPGEWMFPGAGHVDGTLEGAMKAGMAAYP